MPDGSHRTWQCLWPEHQAIPNGRPLLICITLFVATLTPVILSAVAVVETVVRLHEPLSLSLYS